MENISIIINGDILSKYEEYYFEKYPRRKKFPIAGPIPPSLNYFTSIKRMAQNSLKQKYKEFAVWLASYYKIADLNLSRVEFTYEFFFPNHRRRDFDNLLLTPKLLNDGLVDANVIEDDDGERLMLRFEPFKYDKDNPRVEIQIREWKNV